MKKRGRANFNDMTNYHEKPTFLEQVFCKECKMPVGPHDTKCGKCDHEFPWREMAKIMATQAELRADEQNNKNRKYKPPRAYI